MLVQLFLFRVVNDAAQQPFDSAFSSDERELILLDLFGQTLDLKGNSRVCLHFFPLVLDGLYKLFCVELHGELNSYFTKFTTQEKFVAFVLDDRPDLGGKGRAKQLDRRQSVDPEGAREQALTDGLP